MKTTSSPPATTPSLADRLEALAGFWQGAHQGQTRLTPPACSSALRDDLTDIALAAEAKGEASLFPALRRIAFLSEVCECLEAEPDQAEAAAQVADFCARAIEQLVWHQRNGNGNGQLEICDGILRQSDERWSDYLSAADPIGADQAIADQAVPFDDGWVPRDNDPPALDQATLLRLLQGSGLRPTEPALHETLPGSRRSDECRNAHSAATGGSPQAAAGPESSISAAPGEGESRAAWSVTPQEPGLAIPPLPTRFDLDDEIREAFIADAGDLFERIEKIVVGLSSRDNQREAIDELCRCFHTLKGAAGSVGLNELATLVHELEERIGHVGAVVSPGLYDLLYEVVDYLDRLIDLLRRAPARFRPTNPPPLTRPGATVAPAALSVDFSEGPTPAIAEPISSSRMPSAEGSIRVSAARFDELTDLASELIVQGRFWLSQAESMKTFAATVQLCRNRLLASLDRLYDVALGPKGRRTAALVDPQSELPDQLRRLVEQADDLAVLAASAHAAAAPMADRGDTAVRLSLQVWDSFQSLRIFPIRGLFMRLAHVIHDAARVEGRQVEVVMKGEETGVDRAVQDRAFEPLLHVVRNAVAHGIETGADRVKAGKPATGRVTLEASREGNTLVIVVLDDGKGLDDQAIAAKARRLGWLGRDENPSRERLHAFIFQPGFSTKSQADEISGRGVGMDVVAREVDNLRGTLDLTSQPGRGTRLTIRLPARLALEPALIVRVAGQPLAVPAALVEHVQPYEPPVPSPDTALKLGRTDFATTSIGHASVIYGDQTLPVVFAGEMLGIRHSSSVAWRKLVLVRAGSRLIGLVVDTIDGAEDLVIKPLGALLAGHPLVSGTSLSINGEVISVLHPSGLERWLNVGTDSGVSPAASRTPGPFHTTPGERIAVLVVDDSISVRRGLARQLCGLGLEVHEVSDGLEALRRLHDVHYGLVLTDLEMPRLDGFALLAEIKRSASLATVPVIAASTRCDPETRRRVLELGARALLAKPVDPVELARIVKTLLPGVRA